LQEVAVQPLHYGVARLAVGPQKGEGEAVNGARGRVHIIVAGLNVVVFGLYLPASGRAHHPSQLRNMRPVIPGGIRVTQVARNARGFGIDEEEVLAHNDRLRMERITKTVERGRDATFCVSSLNDLH